MAPEPETERRLSQLEQAEAECTRRVDDLYKLVGELVVADAGRQAATAKPEAGAEAGGGKARWLEQVPVKWVVIWGCAVVTLVLATMGAINPTLLESLWKFLAGAVGVG